MDFDELLNDVEAMLSQTPRPSKTPEAETSNLKAHVNKNNVKINDTPVFIRSRSNTVELDDLLSMFDGGNDEAVELLDDKPSNFVHHKDSLILPTSARHMQASDGLDENHKKKCSQVLLGGETKLRGLQTPLTANSTVCGKLRCNECDFTVLQFPGERWAESVDYMFFRENMPNISKLRKRLETFGGYSAYACQCHWISMSPYAPGNPKDYDLKWVCIGH